MARLTTAMRTVVLAGMLALAAAPAEARQDPPAARPNAGEQQAAASQEALRQEALTTVRGRQQAAMTNARKALAAGEPAVFRQHIADYRRLITAQLLLETLGKSKEERLKILQDHAALAELRWRTARDTARAFLISRLAETSDEAERRQIFNNVTDALEGARAAHEMAQEAIRRLEPTMFTRDRPVNRTQERLRELLERISSNYVEEPLRPSYGITPGNISGAPQSERDAEHWLRQREREADIAEYVRLARGGVFVDPATGQPIEGTERQRIARNAERQLVEALTRANLSEGVLATLMGFADTRVAVAGEREADIAASDEYRALDFINPNIDGPETPEIFRALALAVRREQDRINAWRAARIPEGGEGGVTGWLYENFVAKQKVGLGRASEIGGWGLTGDSLEQIDRRIAIFQRDADAVVDAFGAAATTPNPKDLLHTPEGRAHHRLLDRYGYIARDADGNETYRIPNDARVSQRAGRDLRLPGSSWLDIISGANVMKLVLLAAAPELAAARFGVLLEGLELGAGAVRVGVFVTEALAGTALDVGINLATGEAVDAERMAIESLLLAPVLQGAGRAAGEAGGALAALFKDRARRQAAETFLTQTLGLASESALQTYWQAQLQGKVTYEDFLSNLVNGAISRGARGALDRTADARNTATDALRGARRPRSEIPEGLAPVFAGREGEAARREVSERAAENQKRFDGAERRLREVVGEDLSSTDATSKIVTALERGDYTWADLKMLYRSDPERYKPLMAAANAARARFAENIVARARVRAREQIDAEFRAMTGRFSEALRNDPAQLKEALADASAWREQQLKLVDQDPFAPGSKDLTSDIDRSVASPFLRNALKDVTDADLGGNGRTPPTSARAYDLNEYIDVFPVIRRTRSTDLTSQRPPGFSDLTHQQGMEALSMASAMLHMTPTQRIRFKDNLLRNASGDRQATLKRQIQMAEESLRRGGQELSAEIDRLVKNGADRNDPDTFTRARDNLYGARTQRLHDLEYQLSRVKPDSDEAKRLAAEIEREWSYALREGIETYSTFTGLDVIVVNGQLKDISIRQLIQSADITAEKLGITPEQARSMLNDQTLMIVEHVRAFQEGHESLRDAAAALAKYTERAVLALKLMGADLSRDTAAELDKLAGALMEVRKDPARLEEVLKTFGDNDAERGLQNLIAIAERALPGLDGLFDEPAGPARTDLTTPEGLARARALLGVQREQERERERERVQHGAQAAAASAADRLDANRAELAELKADKARTDRLGQRYNRADWRRAEQLEAARASIAQQIDMLPDQGHTGAVLTGLRQQLQVIDRELTTMRARRTDENNAPTDEEFVRDRRIEVLERQLPDQEKEAAALQQEAEKERRALETAPVDAEGPSITDLDTPTDLEKAAAIFGDLDRPHQNVDPAVTPRDPGPGTTEPRTTGSVGGGFTPATSVPPIDFEIFPGSVLEDETFLDIDDLFVTGPTFFGVLPDPTTQHMISIIDFAGPGLLIPGGAPEPMMLEPARRGPSDAIWMAPLGGSRAGAPQVRTIVTSLGTSTGEAFEVHIVNDGDRPVRISGGGALVLEPLAPGAIPQAQQIIRSLPSAQTVTTKLAAYCLEFVRKPPSAGTVFRIASQELQQKFAPLRDVLNAARRLEQLGVLKPDGNPVAYFHAIRQWAIWTKEQKFDLKSFGRAFVERTKQNFVALGQTWTKEIENAVLARVPGRWADVVRVLEEVEKRAGGAEPR